MIGIVKRRYKDIATIFILLGSLAMMYFRYRTALIRSLSSIKDFFVSIAYYFCQIFDVEIPVSVTKLPDQEILKYLPFSYDEMIRKLGTMWSVVFDKDCFLKYLQKVLKSLNDISMFVLLFLPVFILIPIIISFHG